MTFGIEHLAIIAKDTKVLTDWYTKMFDTEVVYDNGKGTIFLAFSDKSMIEFIPAEEMEREDLAAKRQGIRHIAISVDDFDGAVERLMAENVEVVTAPSTSAKGISTFFFRDIEGNILHLITRPEPLI
ncbi:MAG: VOC family protein [Clostridia bacterium]|nr:VOC family protein [Clostridia bacterium]